MSSRAAVAPPGSLPAFGWRASGRGLGPPLRAGGPVSGRPGRSAAHSPLEPEAASVLAFPTSQGEETVGEKMVDQRWQDSLGNFPHVPGQEWAPAQASDRKNRRCKGVMGRSPSRVDVWGTMFFRPTVTWAPYPLSAAPEEQAGWCP